MKDPAFPTIWIEDENKVYPGMSKRFYAACAAMQGVLAKYEIKQPDNIGAVASISLAIADELIKQEGAS